MDAKVRELLDRIKATASAFGEVAYTAGREAGKKAGETLELAKLNMKIFDLNAEIELIMKKLGKVIYDTHCGKEADEGSIDNLLKEADEKNAEVEVLRAKVAELKKTVICKNCGGVCNKNDQYCRKCGTQL